MDRDRPTDEDLATAEAVEERDPATDDIPDLDLGIEAAVAAPELEDSELGAVLEALLLVVDTPVVVEALAADGSLPAGWRPSCS